ncbi:MAG: YmdB family metallophosphoesterase [Mycoplasmataceae bacterium]|jgi:metallophosphoesterase (TIGR00282 family)|nr:YmdB family metallophosphoesterase [Mycoplasmataceae bacterium]
MKHNATLNILFIGDIFGSNGRRAVKALLPKLIQEYQIDLTIANAENTTHGRGCSFAHYQELKKAGINFFTFGNHTWQVPDYPRVLNNDDVIRPANLNQSHPYAKVGKGSMLINVKGQAIRLTNLLGSSIDFKTPLTTNPFLYLQAMLHQQKSAQPVLHIIDFHAETTSEKNALIAQFNGQVSAIIGTHTHVQTNDAKIVNHTAYLTDAGMTGGYEGIIGAEAKTIIAKFNEQVTRFTLKPAKGKYQFNAVHIKFVNQQPTAITPIQIVEK